MTEDKKDNAIPFPKENEKKEEKLITYIRYYVPFTLVFEDGTSGRGKDVLLIPKRSGTTVTDIELYIVANFAKEGRVDIKDIIIDNMIMQGTKTVKESDAIKCVEKVKGKEEEEDIPKVVLRDLRTKEKIVVSETIIDGKKYWIDNNKKLYERNGLNDVPSGFAIIEVITEGKRRGE